MEKDKKKPQKTEKINHSKANKYAVIGFFLCVAAIAFYFTFKTEIKITHGPNGNAISVIDEKSYPSYLLEEKNSFLNKSSEEEVDRSLMKTQQHWSAIAISYYKGKDVTEALRNYKKSVKNEDLEYILNDLIENIEENGAYRPVEIYREFVKLKNNILAKNSIINFKSFWGKLLNKFVTIRVENIYDSTYQNLAEIEDYIIAQDYPVVYRKLKDLQKICDDGDFSNEILIKIARQNNINELFLRANKKVNLIEINNG